MLRLSIALLLAGSLLAQQQPAAEKPVRRKFDRVAVLIGDKAILESQVEREVKARVEGIEAAGNTVSEEMREKLFRDTARELARQELLAQGTNAMGGASRDLIEQAIQRHLQEYQEQQIQKFGSFSEYARQLELLGRTWDNVVEEQRTQQLARLHFQQEAWRRYRDQYGLIVTPNEIRTYYETHIEEFVRSGSADVEMLTIQAGAEPDTMAARSRVAAEAWAAPGASGAKLAEEYGGILTPMSGVRNVPDDHRAGFIKEFAESAAVGEVSPPRPSSRGRSMQILRLAARNEGRNDELSDPDVQASIAAVLREERLQRLHLMLLMRSQNGLGFWPAWLFAGR